MWDIIDGYDAYLKVNIITTVLGHTEVPHYLKDAHNIVNTEIKPQDTVI